MAEPIIPPNLREKPRMRLTFTFGLSFGDNYVSSTCCSPLADPQGLFNSSLDGNTRRAIDIQEGEALDAKAFKALIQAAVAENHRAGAPKSQRRRRT